MSDIRVDNIKNEAGTGSPGFPYGANVTGIVTATSFSGSAGNLTGLTAGQIPDISGDKITSGTIAAGRIPTLNQNTTGSAASATVAQGLTGSPNITVGTITASGTVSIGGTLTYEDVSNVDSVGLITARNGINVTAGISTFKGANFNGGSLIKEKCHVVAGKLSDNPNIDLENGMVHLYTTADTTICTPDIRMSSSVTLNSVMDIGDTIVVTLISTAGASAYSAQVTIDTAGVTENWIGGEAPTAGGSSGLDIYSYTITKTSNAPAWNVICNLSKTSAA